MSASASATRRLGLYSASICSALVKSRYRGAVVMGRVYESSER